MANLKLDTIGVLCAVAGGIILSVSVTLIQGLIGTAILFLSWYLFSVNRRYRNKSSLANERPILLMKDSKIFKKNLKKVNLTEKDLWTKIERLNLPKENKIFAVVWEKTGELSVLHSDIETEVDEQILEGVER